MTVPRTPRLTTERLILHPIQSSDAFDLPALFAAPEVQRYLFDATPPDLD